MHIYLYFLLKIILISAFGHLWYYHKKNVLDPRESHSYSSQHRHIYVHGLPSYHYKFVNTLYNKIITKLLLKLLLQNY